MTTYPHAKKTGPEAAAATAFASEPDRCTPSTKESVMPSMGNRKPSVNLNPGDRVHLLTIGQDGKLDGGHRPAVLDHIGHDGFARVRADGIGLPLVVELDRLVRETITELDFAQGLATSANARPCLSWCDNPGHADEAPADAACWSDDIGLALNATPFHRGLPIVIETGAHRPVDAIEAVVTLLVRNGEEETSLRLTAWEARRLATDLLHFADMAEEQ